MATTPIEIPITGERELAWAKRVVDTGQFQSTPAISAGEIARGRCPACLGAGFNPHPPFRRVKCLSRNLLPRLRKIRVLREPESEAVL